VKHKYKNRLRYPFQVAFGLMVIGLLVSACSLGQSNTNATPTPFQPHNGPVASTPTGANNLPAGTPLPSQKIIPLVFNLAYNDTAMDNDVVQIYTKGSSSFHKFLTPDQVAQRYALSTDQEQQVENFLKQNGYTILSVDPLRSGIKVQAPVSVVERSLHIKFQTYTVTFQGKTRQVYIQKGQPKLPASIAPLVSSIVGLSNFAYPEFKPPFGLVAHSASAPQTGDCASYATNQKLTRNKLAGAYQFDKLYQQNYQGQGMAVGIAEFSEPYDPNDIANYASCVGIPVPTIHNIAVDGNVAPGSGQGEAAMDVELVAGLAPKADIYVYQGDTSNTSFAQSLVDVFNRVAADNQVQVLSVSYGTAEDQFSSSEMLAVNRSLRKLAAEGISVFISSGDCGAFTLRTRNVAVVSFPASAPYAISVGGTHLQVNDSNVRTSEDVWGADDHSPVCFNEWGSGGGVSENSDFKKPIWQTGSGTDTHYSGLDAHPPVLLPIETFPPQPVTAPNGLRQVPDVAAAAYPNIAVYYKGAWTASGGTSAAAPIFAAGAVLVDQGLKQQGRVSLGGVPEFYTIANQAGGFHPYTDITSGNNLFYPATKGWDYCTGWGSPNFSDILQFELSQ
jgi:kumamolisin